MYTIRSKYIKQGQYEEYLYALEIILNIGYHFSTSLKCYLSSCIMCPDTLAVVRYIPYNIAVWSMMTLTVLIILSVLFSVETTNKPLDEKEQRVFGIVARILIIISAVCWSIITMVFHQLILSKILSFGIINVRYLL